MMTTDIDYGNMMHHAMRGLIRDVMSRIENHGLPGAHHFFITLLTDHPEVEMAEWLRERYPDEITIVIQNWYENLTVDEDGFAITLNFGNQPEPLYIPFDAITTFVDPSVEFGLKFESHLDEDAAEDDESEIDELVGFDEDADQEAPMLHVELPEDPPKTGEVVQLDKFRKN